MKRLLVGALFFAAACSPSTPIAVTSAPLTPPAEPEAPSPSFPLVPTATFAEFATPKPATTCRVLPTPERIEPSHAPVNGQPSLGVPTLSGVILIQIRQCRDIQAILAKYGLPGPAVRDIPVVESDENIAIGATRWFRIGVMPGTESTMVVELYGHPEDIEYVQLIPEPPGRVV
jgi:hypothetical protein